MLTRLKVSGFKNLVDVDIRFGPFTCIAGANGVGKSNLFDAIRFLSLLADNRNTLLDAALSIRSAKDRSGDIRDLFHKVGDRYDETMSFEAEMIIPAQGEDDLGQPAEATITFLRYSLVLAYREGSFANGYSGGFRSSGLEIIKEALEPINKGDAHNHLLFPHSASTWRKQVIRGKGGRGAPFISTDGEGDNRRIQLHQDGGISGRPLTRPANIPRTVLSSVSNAAESPTVVLARREMESWQLLQLEPAKLREPDTFVSPSTLGADGSHLAATLYRLANSSDDPERVYATLANRLALLIDDVTGIGIDRDDKRNLLTLQIADFKDTIHSAQALSDGTLRFLALAVLEADTEPRRLICLEEPENGIHPGRIPAMLRLLQDIAVDPQLPADETNPLRQVIVNTHSPLTAQQVNDDDLVIAELRASVENGRQFRRAAFGYLPPEVIPNARKSRKNWRLQGNEHPFVISIGDLLAYLNIAPSLPHSEQPTEGSKRVIDRADVLDLYQQLILPIGDTG